MSIIRQPTLIAHRGYPSRYPENTLLGYRAAVDAGAKWVETDIQFTSDHHPILYHDSDLVRVSGQSGVVLERTLTELQTAPASFPKRFGDRFADEPIATLDQFVDFLRHRPAVQVMVEMKTESIDRFGAELTLRGVYHAISTIADRSVVISKSWEFLRRARADHGLRTGWVMTEWSDDARKTCDDQALDFILCAKKRFPDDQPVWPGPWDWVIYSIDNPQVALEQPQRGIHFVETDAIGEMLEDERLKPS